MEKMGYVLLALVALCWLGAMIAGMIIAFPVGLIGFAVILGLGFLFIKVIRDRLANKDDDHYSKTVER